MTLVSIFPSVYSPLSLFLYIFFVASHTHNLLLFNINNEKWKWNQNKEKLDIWYEMMRLASYRWSIENSICTIFNISRRNAFVRYKNKWEERRRNIRNKIIIPVGKVKNNGVVLFVIKYANFGKQQKKLFLFSYTYLKRSPYLGIRKSKWPKRK